MKSISRIFPDTVPSEYPSKSRLCHDKSGNGHRFRKIAAVRVGACHGVHVLRMLPGRQIRLKKCRQPVTPFFPSWNKFKENPPRDLMAGTTFLVDKFLMIRKIRSANHSVILPLYFNRITELEYLLSVMVKVSSPLNILSSSKKNIFSTLRPSFLPLKSTE